MQLPECLKATSFIPRELGSAELGDSRRVDRLQTIAAAAVRSPAESFPKLAGSAAELEGTYRFLNNESVTPEGILAGHFSATATRVREFAGPVVVASDTSEFTYGAHQRDDLDPIGHGDSFGFRVHMGLAVTADEARLPLGLIDLLPFEKASRKGRKPTRQSPKPESSKRWSELVARVRKRLGEARNVIHTMDREADDYALLAALTQAGERFVVRQSVDRRLEPRQSEPKVRSELEGTPVLAERTVAAGERRRGARRQLPGRHPPRDSRLVRLEVRAATVTIPRPLKVDSELPDQLELNLVHAVEVDPPAGEDAIEWWLWTREPVDTAQQVLFVLDCYRCRWVIEEFFKALKTGCALERRQLETKDALLNALALFCPIAWRLLLLRNLARAEPDAPAETALSPSQLFALRGLFKRVTKKELPQRLTARAALWAIAQLGGHIANNGDPGWIVIGRGFERILDVEAGVLIARGQM